MDGGLHANLSGFIYSAVGVRCGQLRRSDMLFCDFITYHMIRLQLSEQ